MSMSLTNDIPTKLRVPAQLALDAKSVVTTLSQLQTLGTNNNLAYTYYKGMPVICAENLGLYRWRPVREGETGGTLPSNFIYPAGIVSEDGVVYSNIAYNFFKETTITAENINSVIALNNIGEGADIYKDFTTPLGVLTFNLRTIIKDALGAGEELIDSVEVVGDNVVVKGKTIGTTNLNIYVEEDGTIMIDSPTSTSNLSFYVDVNSVADTETGTLSAPFKTLNKALDKFIGTGTWYNPQFKGYKITLLSACNLFEAAGVDYNGYVNLDINNLNIEGNGSYLGLYTNPSSDYYPISTRRMVTAMPKTSNILDYPIIIRFNNVIFQRIGTNAIVDNLNYSFPTATLAGAFPPPQNDVSLWITNCTLTNDTNRNLSGNFSVVPNPNDGGNPLLMFGVPVYASASEPIGVPMVKTEGRSWNKEGTFRLGNSRLVNSTGTAIKAIDTTYSDFYDFNVINMNNYYRLYESVVNNYYSPRLGFAMIDLENVNYFAMNNLKLNWVMPRMITTEAVPRDRIIGGVETMFKLKNSTLHIVGDSSEQDQVENLIQMDGNSYVTLDGYRNNGQVSDKVHGLIKVITPLPLVTPKEIAVYNSYLHSVIVDDTGVDKSYIKQINGNKNTINNAPHSSYLLFVNDTAARAAGLIKCNVYYNTTIGGLTSVF